ncbi:hypothetical protein AMELA_G00094770 [Ameiurus melas]|uniref:Uncharacterized protein n=1 Tax=Ameiurus melas TaxID=219545 RepID=A0A7J6AXE9_AMEME|nr:hypothetical protein AMELA_G00094770 [Ameiurus melas]
MPDSSSTLYKTCQDPLWASTGQAEREEQPLRDVIIPGKIAALASGCSWEGRYSTMAPWLWLSALGGSRADMSETSHEGPRVIRCTLLKLRLLIRRHQ